MAKQIYVLDTCVLLHSPNAIYNFDEHDVFLSLAVIDDLDEIKTRKETVGWSARETFRLLEQYNLKDLTTKGVRINDKGGRLFIHNTEIPNSKTDIPNITRVNSDNAIINTCLYLKQQNPKKKVTLVSKDTGLRIRAQSWGCIAENYRSDLIQDQQYNGIRYVELTEENIKDYELLWSQSEVNISSFSENLQRMLGEVYVNEFLIFCWGDKKCPTRYINDKLQVLKTKSNGNGKPMFSGISPKNLEQTCAIELLADDNVPLVSMCGPAGTGKTMLALAVSLQNIFDGKYRRLIVIKPIVPVGGRDLGALPGDKWEKLSAWLGPIKDNIEQLIASGKDKQAILSLNDLVEDGIIEVEAMTYIQGRSIPDSIVMVDEVQNLTPREARMVVERCGKNSKIILLGDTSQVENAYLDSRSCGLAHSMNGSKGKDKCGVITLSKVERSALSAIASEIFSQPEARR